MSNILGYFFHRKRIKIAIAVAIVLLVIYPLVIRTKKSFADEISLFPTVCEGSWANAAEAAGDPADNRLIGAKSQAAGDIITCHSFDTSALPKGATISDAHLELVWTEGDQIKNIVEPSIEESYDSIAPVTEENPVIEKTEKEILNTETLPSIDQENTQKLPESKSIDSNNNDSQPQIEPTSRLPHWIQSLFIPEAQAEEQIVAPVENTKTESLNIEAEQVPAVQSNQENVITEETVLSETTNTIEVSNDNNPSSEASSEQIQSKTEIEVEKSNETRGMGTALYDITYTASDNKATPLGEITHEHLSQLYPISLTADDLVVLNIFLTSRMTYDQVNNLFLQGMKLVVEYSAKDSLDPIRQPNLEVDTILDDTTIDGIEAIRIKREDNKQYEIWYRVLEPEELTNNIQQEEKVSTQNDEPFISDSPEISISVLPEIKSEYIHITETAKPVIENSEENIISLPTNTINPESFLDTKTSNKKKRHYWNFVDGDNSVNRDTPVGLQDGYIFWLNKKGTVLNSFNILTQGYSSQLYQPENGVDFIIYRNPSSQEKKAILNFEKKFIFSE